MTTQSLSARSGTRTWTPARLFALLFGVVYTLVGAAGFAVTGVHDFTGMNHDSLLIFHVNPAHNVIHLLLGIVWIAACGRHGAAKLANLGIGIVLGLVTVLGFAGGMGLLGMSGLADPDNFLHLATATLALYFGSVAAGSPAAGSPAAGSPATAGTR